MREISTEKIKIGEHVIIDGEEYVAKEGDGCDICPVPQGDSVFCGLCPIGGHIEKVKKEPKYRPYKDTDEMIADWKERFKPKDWPSYSMPQIWVIWDDTKSYIDGFSKNEVSIRGYYRTMDGLFKAGCTYLDGSPCGKEVTE